MEKHKCTGCGFLADGNTFGEVNEKGRRGEDSNIFARDSFVCIEGKMDFGNETDPSGAAFVASVALAVLQKERDCSSFREWRRGSSPREHREMMDREKMLKWQEEREGADRRWRSRQDLKLVLIAGCFTILGGLLTYFLGGR